VQNVREDSWADSHAGSNTRPLLECRAGAADRRRAHELLDFSLHFLPIFFSLWAWLAFWAKRPFATLGFERHRAATRFLTGGAAIYLRNSVPISNSTSRPSTAGSFFNVPISPLLVSTWRVTPSSD